MTNKRNSHPLVIFRRLLRQSPHRWLLIASAIISVLIPVTLVLMIHFERILIDLALDHNVSSVITCLYWLGAVLLIRVSLTWLFAVVSGQYNELSMLHLRKAAVSSLTRANVRQFEEISSGDIISRLTNDLNGINQFLSKQVYECLLMPLVIGLSFAYLVSINWWLTISVCIISSLLSWWGARFSRPVSQISRQLQERLALANSTAKDAIGGLEVNRAFNLAEHFDEKFHHDVAGVVEKEKELAKQQSLLEWITTFNLTLPDVLLYAICGYLVFHGKMTVGALWAYKQLYVYVKNPLSSVPEILGLVRMRMTAVERVLEVLELEPERHHGTVTQPDLSGDYVVDIAGLSFSYGEDRGLALNNVDLKIRKGEKVALVGASGSGKSTIAKLIMGFYTDYDGDISIMGHSLTHWDLHALRDNIAYIAQDCFLFPGSIKDNIKLVKPDASDAEVIKAAKLANAHNFICSFREGYNSLAGELGARLSGGQRQRIAIARAFMKNSHLILLDEPTASLDANAQSIVQHSLDNLTQGSTCLIITHRLSTIRDADRIIVLDKGRVVGVGTHEELLSSNPHYIALYSRELNEQERQVG